MTVCQSGLIIILSAFCAADIALFSERILQTHYTYARLKCRIKCYRSQPSSKSTTHYSHY